MIGKSVHLRTILICGLTFFSLSCQPPPEEDGHGPEINPDVVFSGIKYIGFTEDLESRIKSHNQRNNPHTVSTSKSILSRFYSKVRLSLLFEGKLLTLGNQF